LTKELSRNIILTNELGLHARPAAMIAELAKNAKSKVWITRGDDKVDASSIIDIMTLACMNGTEITLQVGDASDIDILHKIIGLFETGFGE
jgi:phosphotransferase system HPr (HPr) family protein